MRALVRWAGSKRNLLGVLKEHVPPSYGRYVEPFAGSACLFFCLEPTHGILGDINQELIQAYKIVRRFPGKIWSTLMSLEQSEEAYYQMRSADPKILSSLDRAVRFLYLNRFCFNGVYRTNRRGEFNVPMGRNTGSFPGLVTFRDCARLLRMAELKNGDFEETLRDVAARDFVYLDPPYFKLGRLAYVEYGYSRFDKVDLDRLFAALRSLDHVGARFLMSYTEEGASYSQLKRWNVVRVEAPRHVAGFAASRANVFEILVSNY